LNVRSIVNHITAASGKEFEGACSSDFWYRLRMEPTEEQFNALGNYRDIITQNASKVAEALGISPQTLTGWTEGKGEPTSEQADKILEFLRQENKAG
jgi:transcriptional regulator with XRE-family HTH domain